MGQVYPGDAELTDAALAGLYAYPELGAPPARWLRANMVESMDGAATLDGRSGGLSGEADERVFAMLRALADVILVGAGTARAEGYGPVRPETEGLRWAWLRDGRPPSPPIAVVTRALDLDPGGPLLTEAPPHARTIVITTGSAPAQRRAAVARTAEVIVAGETSVDLKAAVGALAGRGHQRIPHRQPGAGRAGRRPDPDRRPAHARRRPPAVHARARGGGRGLPALPVRAAERGLIAGRPRARRAPPRAATPGCRPDRS